MDKVADKPINGENHTTPSNITVAADHCYYVWVEIDGYVLDVKKCPNGWTIILAPDADGDGYSDTDGEAAYGCTSVAQYQVHFTSAS
jgi:hypothetical protein